MNRQWRYLTKGVILALLAILFPQSADAIPTFARKYQTSCMTCHESFPRLNAVGEAFRLNGYKFLDDEMYIKEEPVEMGDEAYKNLWPKNAVWPSSIPGLPPISLTLRSEFDYDAEGDQVARTNFAFPNQIKLLGAGAFGEHLSFFVELGFEQGSAGHGGHGGEEESGVEVGTEGWVQFEDLFGFENTLNLRVGTVGMQEFGLFTARNHNRLTLSPYLYASGSVPTLGHHQLMEIQADLGLAEMPEFESSPFMIHAQPGIELNGFGGRWRYALGVVNGNGSVSDNNSEKDVYLQLAYKFGGRAFDGSLSEGEAGLGGAEPWRDNSVTLALFGYRGTETVHAGDVETEDDFWRVGPGIRWKHNDWVLNVGYAFGQNDDPYGDFGTESVDSHAWFVEGEYFVFPWLVTTCRYEGMKVDLDSGIFDEDPDAELQRLIVSAKALIRANLSLIAEGRFNTKEDGPIESLGGGDQIALALNYAF
ncbi:MAG: hypothetical protein IIB38_05650 [Candidatus Hydrogenedentes bacterium]|nr:hypothetical protein [Candidatus Hydrogenedentota bacterium]